MMSQTSLTTGVASPKDLALKICSDHTFTHQECPSLDVVVSSDDGVGRRLGGLATRYGCTNMKLFDAIERVVDSTASNIFALSLSAPDTEDTWCIDNNKRLSLLLSKETHQWLGLVGAKCKVGSRSDSRFLVQIDLKSRDTPALSRTKAAIKKWEEERASEGLLDWNVVYHPGLFLNKETHPISCISQTRDNIRIPTPHIRPRPYSTRPGNDDETAVEEWPEDMHALFEWVGMACLGSARLLANDRVDPYVAVYDCPSPSYIGSVTHLRWDAGKGVLSPDFVQELVQDILKSLPLAESTDSPKQPFVAITAQIHPDALASYAKSGNQSSLTKVVKCWSVIATRSSRSLEGATDVERNADNLEHLPVNWVRAVVEM